VQEAEKRIEGDQLRRPKEPGKQDNIKVSRTKGRGCDGMTDSTWSTMLEEEAPNTRGQPFVFPPAVDVTMAVKSQTGMSLAVLGCLGSSLDACINDPRELWGAIGASVGWAPYHGSNIASRALSWRVTKKESQASWPNQVA